MSSTIHSPSKPTSSRWKGAIPLFLGGLFLLFAMGRNTVAMAAWISPIFLLRYTRTVRQPLALLAAWATLFLAYLFQFRGMIPLPLTGVLLVGFGSSLAGFLPYLVDRFTHRQKRSFIWTLVFPCAVASVAFSTTLSPYGSWGVLGYSQYGNLQIMQLSSVTGIYGISFLVAWLGSVVNWAWERKFEWRPTCHGWLIFGGVFAIVYSFGTVRLWSGPGKGTQRIAGVAETGGWTFPNRSVEERFWNGKPLSEGEMAPIKAALAEQADHLFARSEREAKAGSQLIFWSELALWVLKPDEPALIRKASEFTRRNQVYLGMALGTIDPTQSRLHQNKLVLVGPDGRVLFEYLKSRPVPGGEKATTEVNGNPMRFADTSLGRVGGFICFDLDFPTLVRQAGRDHADLMIAPAGDWEAIDPWHTQMAAFRAVENGFNFVRAVSNGRSLATDYLGRTLAEVDYFNSDDHVIVTEIPIHGVRTLYAQVGDLFAWLCLGTLIVLLAASRRPIKNTAA